MSWWLTGRACPSPSVSVTAGGATAICQGNSVTLMQSNAAPGCSFQWKINGVDMPVPPSSYMPRHLPALIQWKARPEVVWDFQVACGNCRSCRNKLILAYGWIKMWKWKCHHFPQVGTTTLEWYDASTGGDIAWNWYSSFNSIYFANYNVLRDGRRSSRGVAVQLSIDLHGSDLGQDVRCGNGTITHSATDAAYPRWYSPPEVVTATLRKVLAQHQFTYHVYVGNFCPSSRIAHFHWLIQSLPNPVAVRCGLDVVVVLLPWLQALQQPSTGTDSATVDVVANTGHPPSISSTTTYTMLARAAARSTSADQIPAAAAQWHADCQTWQCYTWRDRHRHPLVFSTSGGTQVGSGIIHSTISFGARQ